jgi:DtxR family transcriptional regulator, Mn-dependent transcriptional regulator
MTTLAEENYLKAILKISDYTSDMVATNAIAKELDTKASSVTEMIKKLTDKKLVIYQKYKGVSLSKKGFKTAIDIVRKHRIWESFLVSKLAFEWNEVHDVAEQLEHVKSQQLINALDDFLGNPKNDPHGEPIPDKNGNFPSSSSIPLDQFPLNIDGKVMGVTNDSKSLLKYLDSISLSIGCNLRIVRTIEFDNSLEIRINNTPTHISHKVAKNLLIKEL